MVKERYILLCDIGKQKCTDEVKRIIFLLWRGVVYRETILENLRL